MSVEVGFGGHVDDIDDPEATTSPQVVICRVGPMHRGGGWNVKIDIRVPALVVGRC